MIEHPLRVGIIGAVWGARAHLPAWRSLEGVEVTAICTSQPETAALAAEQFGVARAFHDFRAMAADPAIDIVDCGTRPALRREMVLAALAAGKHVYNGIPFARDLDDANLMTRAWREAGTVAVVDAFMQAVPALVQMKAMIGDGWIGETFGAEISFEAPLFTAAQTNVPEYVWFADPANGASALRNLGSHMLHLLVHFFGPVARLAADTSRALNAWPLMGETIRPRVPDRASLMLRHRSGLPVRLEANWARIGGRGFRFAVWGSHGQLLAYAPLFPMAHDTRLFGTRDPDLGAAALVEVPLDSTFLVLAGSSARPDRPETGLFALAAVFAAMRDAVRDGMHSGPDFARALQVHEIVEAAELAAREGSWLDLPVQGSCQTTGFGQ